MATTERVTVSLPLFRELVDTLDEMTAAAASLKLKLREDIRQSIREQQAEQAEQEPSGNDA